MSFATCETGRRISHPALHRLPLFGQVPDTLDIAERAKLGINAVAGCTDHEQTIMHWPGVPDHVLHREHILDFRSKSLYVNLQLNRASAWADVHSYILYEGRVDLKFKKECERELSGCQSGSQRSPQVSCEMNGRGRSVNWHGRYVAAGHTKPGDVITVKFPISERKVRQTIGGVDYTLIIPRQHRDFHRSAGPQWTALSTRLLSRTGTMAKCREIRPLKAKLFGERGFGMSYGDVC